MCEVPHCREKKRKAKGGEYLRGGGGGKRWREEGFGCRAKIEEEGFGSTASVLFVLFCFSFGVNFHQHPLISIQSHYAPINSLKSDLYAFIE